MKTQINIHDAIEDWHEGVGPSSLIEHLGMTREQYKLWALGEMSYDELSDLGYYDE